LTPAPASAHRIVILGGGAGGLELATRLGNGLGRRGRAEVTLVDRSATHMWKPLLHEVAAGSLDVHAHQLDFLAQAHWHHFAFRLGAVEALDRARKVVTVAPVADDDGEPMLPRRELDYDTLVICVGGMVNDFGIPGVAKHAVALDRPEEAERFNRKLIAACVRADAAGATGPRPRVDVVIVGAGATGVELAAELRATTHVLASYGLKHFDPRAQMRITLLEAAERILPPLPEKVAAATAELLGKLDIEVLVAERVVEITADHVATASGKRLPADLCVWAAGVKAPDWLAGFGGLATNRANQIIVGPTLQTVTDPDVFAFGDCAECPWPEKERTLPPLAQAAHQQASHITRQIRRRLAGQPLTRFRYANWGSLVSLGDWSAVGNLMGGLIGGNLFVEGLVARLMYVSNYNLHLAALHGWPRVALHSFGRFLRERTEPRVKLH
jgi:NADH dehydrogenase